MPVSRVTNHRGTASETDLQLDDHLRRSDRAPIPGHSSYTLPGREPELPGADHVPIADTVTVTPGCASICIRLGHRDWQEMLL